jgi:hypothetical protein
MHVEQALNDLTFSTKKAAGILRKVLESAIANAEHNEGADVDELQGRRGAGQRGPDHEAHPGAGQGPRGAHFQAHQSHHRDRRGRVRSGVAGYGTESQSNRHPPRHRQGLDVDWYADSKDYADF